MMESSLGGRTGRTRWDSSTQGAQASYLEQANRGQALLEQGQFQQALEVFQAALMGLPPEPSFAHAVLIERIGRCMIAAGKPAAAMGTFRQALNLTRKIALTDGVEGLRCMLQSSLGDAYRAAGHLSEARKAYEAALELSTARNDRRAQGIDLDHLGALALTEGRLDDALVHYRAALDLFELTGERASAAIARHHLGRALLEAQQWEEAEKSTREAAQLRTDLGDVVGAAQSSAQLAFICEKAGRPDAAENWHRKALAAARTSKDPFLLRHQLAALANHLRARAEGVTEALELLREALGAVTIETFSTDVWVIYGLLADILDGQAGGEDAERQARNYRHVEQFGPRLQSTLAEIGEVASLARAVLLARFGRCFLIGGRPDLGVIFLQEAWSTAHKLTPSDDARKLLSATQIELGSALIAGGTHGAARVLLSAALLRAREMGELGTEAVALRYMGDLAAAEDKQGESRMHARSALALFDAIGDRASAAALHAQIGPVDALSDTAEVAQTDHDFALTLQEEMTVDCLFDSDLMIDLAQGVRRTPWIKTPPALAAEQVPVLVPQTRPFLADDGTIRFCLPFAEPMFEQQDACVVMRKTRCEVAVSGKSALVWQLVRALDGTQSIAAILSAIAPADRDAAERLLGALVATGVIDASGRPFGRFVHAATKKGVLPGGGLEGDRVMQLVADGNYRAYPEAKQVPLSQAVPDRLCAFHHLTRARRSRRDYTGGTMSAGDFAALLNTACGITGAMPWEGREVKLRAYPSSGALYAVEIYPIVFGVEGLETGVYHYVPSANALEAVRPDADYEQLVAAVLPVEREMVASVAAMICLVGRFRRHERKYGEGGYRMMVAEAGHISQNLVLAATALGLAARPFGGVMDRLLNHELGLDEDEEQFLLSVLVGHSASAGAQAQEEKPGGTA
jgi:SagB-type dehydrogenase family enzyme